MSEPTINVTKIGYWVPVSREVLGYNDRTPEQREADRAAMGRRTQAAMIIWVAAQEALAATTDPVARAVLDLHKRGPIGCEGCPSDTEYGPENYPCDTVATVAAALDIEMPELEWGQ